MKKRARRGDAPKFVDHAVLYNGEDCLIWPYNVHPTGYGLVRNKGKTSRAHRIICDRAHGNPPTENHQAAHSCGNPSCVNQRHLRWATPTENMADAIRHGTMKRGENQPRSVLKESDVKEICVRLNSGGSQRTIAAAFGVSQSAICLINSGKTWRWLTGYPV